ncbi:RNA polymerase sigma factor [Acidicapsa ligni]|uniref:RNA polymerase sigma factor n=1 Tax=Acidicapsa ligni TaxID=542300 RepID=UPI0021DFF78C|nr:RNA polymerase sigma factor [Acidicapsa ligni]
MSFTNSIDEALYPESTIASSSAKPTEIEREVLGLFEQLRAPVLRYTLSFGIPMHDAEEVTQEVFLALFRHLQLDRSRKNLRGWIFRVAHNLALKQRYVNQRIYDKLDYDDAIEDTHHDPSPNPEQLLSFAQRQHHLLTIVDALPATDQSCLRLRAEGLRYREIAAILGISLGSVSISLTRSLARLGRAEGR